MSVDNNSSIEHSRNIPKGWVKTTLGDVCEKMYSGGTPSTKREDYYGGKIPWIRTQEVKFNFIREVEIKITEKGFSNSSAKWIPKNTVIIAMYGNSAGRVALSKVEATTNQACCNFVSDENKSNPFFIFYNLLSRYKEIEGKANGAAQQNLSVGVLKILNINLPPLKEQTAIAQILTAFDDKIALLQAQNNTLETTAQTIFKEWFGKYQIGDELPDGWRVGEIGDFITETIGGDYGKEAFIDDFTEETICLRGTDLPDMKMGVPEKAPVRFLKPTKIKKCKLVSGDIVIEISGGTENQSTGRVAYINEYILNNSKLPMTCVNFCRILRLKDSDNSYFIYSLFEYLYKRKVLFNWENGTTGIKNLNLKALLKDFDLVLPISNEMIDKYNQIVKSSFRKIQENNAQIQTLKKTRDTLLPKLMSGSLRVDEFKEPAI